MPTIHGVEVKGIGIDEETRCAHYRTEIDIIAIKFPCCNTYYPCHLCHSAVADHTATVWKHEQFHSKAVFCGACGMELSIHEYLNCDAACPRCKKGFNPACSRHYHLYFEV